MSDRTEYWNPVMETLPQEKIRQLQLKKFQRIFSWVYNNSKFHHSLYQQAGIKPGDIRKFEDIQKVPKVEKSMMRAIQAKDPYPYGDLLCVPLEQVTEYHQTSGTTGQPVYQADTWQDWEWWAESWAYCLYGQGYRKTDRVYLPFGYTSFVAFWAAHYGAEKVGCEIVAGGILNTEQRLLKMKEIRATAFMATPTYVLGMADTAKTKLGMDPRELKIKRITVAGEPGAGIPATRKRMEDAWGTKVFDQVGATEIGAWGNECTHQTGLHVNEALFLVEIEDIDTGAIISGPGRKGKMVITALDRIGQPCVRFDSKDIIEWSPEQCSCGRTFRLIKGGVQGRSDDITKVKGVLLSPAAIEDAVRAIPELSNEYEVTVTKKGDIDDISLKVELAPGHESNVESIKARLIDQLRIKTQLAYNLEFLNYGNLPRSDAKARRFKDLRKKEH
jgi:phenylacetate-CoA ligase